MDMSVYDRQIAYINLMENGEKTKNAGYLKWESDGKKHKVEIFVKGLYPTDTTMVDMKTREGKLFDRMKLVQGNGIYRKEVEGLTIGQDDIPVGDFEQIIFHLPGNRYLETSWVNKNKADTLKKIAAQPVKVKEIVEQEMILEENEPEHNNQELNTLAFEPEKKESFKVNPKNNSKDKLYETRWERLRDMFEIIHPFGNEREFLKITPEDFYILRESYQHLGHNSFLLHGFYNYHYLILGKKDTSSNDTYLLGVPGVYYDREIMAAKMFGFEGFDCSKPQCEAGSFGYYCITVE